MHCAFFINVLKNESLSTIVYVLLSNQNDTFMD